MNTIIVTIAERPELARTTGTWRWEAFLAAECGLSEVLERENACAASPDLMPTVLVMLDEDRPVGMVALCLDDLDGRPELNPWLAGLYVDHEHRGNGYGRRLINELETLAANEGIKRLSLYTSDAVDLYASVGWSTVEAFERDGRTYSIMQKHIGHPG